MDNLQVAERIKKLREKHRLTKNALANLAGVSPTYIYQLEQGLKSPTVEYLGYICQALNVSLSDFLSASVSVLKAPSASPRFTCIQLIVAARRTLPLYLVRDAARL